MVLQKKQEMIRNMAFFFATDCLSWLDYGAHVSPLWKNIGCIRGISNVKRFQRAMKSTAKRVWFRNRHGYRAPMRNAMFVLHGLRQETPSAWSNVWQAITSMPEISYCPNPRFGHSDWNMYEFGFPVFRVSSHPSGTRILGTQSWSNLARAIER